MVPSARSAAVLLLLSIAPHAVAQDPEPDPRVPSLTPREFEIRGDVRVALPQIERQPLSGFGPPPRTYVVPADRVAVTGAYAPELDDLPTVPLVAPIEPASQIRVTETMRLEGTYGSGAGRTGRFDLAVPVSSGQLIADLDYDALGWSTDFSDLPFDLLSADASLRTGGTVQFEVFGGGRIHRYGLPEVRQNQNLSSPPLRRLSSIEGGLGVEGLGATPFKLRARYAADRLTPENASLATGLGPEQTSGMVDAVADITVAGRLRVDGGAGTIGLDGGPGQDVQYGAAGAVLLLGRPGSVEFSLGARALAYEVAATAGDGSSRVVSPVVNLSIPAGPTLRLFASNDPQIIARGLGDHFEINPFGKPRPVLAPDVLRVNARAGAEVTNGPVQIRGFAHFTEAPTWLIFDRSGDGLFLEGYEGVRIQGVTAEATLVSRSGVTFDAGVTIREGDIENSPGVIPFFASNVVRAGIQIPFSRGRLAVTAYREGSRSADRADLVAADDFSLLSADLRFDLTRYIALVGQAERLAGTVQEWPGYRLPGFTVRGGLRVTL